MANEPDGAGGLTRLLREQVPAVLGAVRGSTVEELRLEGNGTSVAIRRTWQEAPAAAASETPAAPPPAQLSRLAAPGRTEVRAQVVGVFHRARELDGPVLASEGERVDGGKAIGVIETLGIANDVVAPVAGRLEELRVQDGQPVEYGELIAVILPE